jgi:hypothetical protein
MMQVASEKVFRSPGLLVVLVLDTALWPTVTIKSSGKNKGLSELAFRYQTSC